MNDNDSCSNNLRRVEQTRLASCVKRNRKEVIDWISLTREGEEEVGRNIGNGFALQSAWFVLVAAGQKSRPFSLAVFAVCVCVYCMGDSKRPATWDWETERGKSMLMVGQLRTRK